MRATRPHSESVTMRLTLLPRACSTAFMRFVRENNNDDDNDDMISVGTEYYDERTAARETPLG
jgi:hypothetical protein